MPTFVMSNIYTVDIKQILDSAFFLFVLPETNWFWAEELPHQWLEQHRRQVLGSPNQALCGLCWSHGTQQNMIGPKGNTFWSKTLRIGPFTRMDRLWVGTIIWIAQFAIFMSALLEGHRIHQKKQTCKAEHFDC